MLMHAYNVHIALSNVIKSNKQGKIMNTITYKIISQEENSDDVYLDDLGGSTDSGEELGLAGPWSYSFEVQVDRDWETIL